MDETQFKIISEKIDKLSKMLVLNLIRDLEFKDKIVQLNNLGLKEAEIVQILNSTRDKVHGVMRKL